MPDIPKDADAELLRATYPHSELMLRIANRLDSRAIPVGERLPEEAGRYWVYYWEDEIEGPCWGCAVFEDGWFSIQNTEGWEVEDHDMSLVTHWLPLPPPPTS